MPGREELQQIVDVDTNTEDDEYYDDFECITRCTNGEPMLYSRVPVTKNQPQIHRFQQVDAVVKQEYNARCPYLGLVLATISSLFFSLCSVIVKWMVSPITATGYHSFYVNPLPPSDAVRKQKKIF